MAGVTQSELARALGISRSTVAAALNPHSAVHLKASTRKRVVREAEKRGYRPHRYAQIMRTGKSGIIGVLHFGGLSQVSAERVFWASRAIKEAGYQVLTSDASWTPEGMKWGCEALLGARVEGVLITGWNGLMEKNYRVFPQAGVPVLALCGEALPRVPQVRADTRKAFCRLGAHLLEQGRRRLGLLLALPGGRLPRPGVAGDWSGSERLEGFRAALEAVGGKVVNKFARAPGSIEGLVRSGLSEDPFDPFSVPRRVMADLLAEGPLPDALVCGNDDWAIGAMVALREAGLRVPEDVAVTGYDNTAVGACLEVPLTSMSQPSLTMAERAVELLLKKIAGRRVLRRVERFPCRLIVRASCGLKVNRVSP